MKVEKEMFSPITITLQTKGEADILWAALNTPFSDLVKQSHNHIPKYLKDLHYKMWTEYNNIYSIGW